MTTQPSLAKPAFTPGPWRVRPRSSGLHQKLVIQVGGALVARCEGGNAEEAEANACLIAAAPELYAALRATQIELLMLHPRLGSPYQHSVSVVLAQVRAVLAAVEGG